MKKFMKSKWFVAILIAITATGLFLISFGITRHIINKSITKQASQEIVYDKKEEKKKFVEENIKDEKAKQIIELEEAKKEAEENGKDYMAAMDEVLRARNYTDEYKKYLELSDEEKKELEVIPREQKVDESEFEEIEKEQDEDLDEEDIVIPERFNLNEVIDLKVEHQGEYGLCWIFASNNSLETNLALTKNKNYDLSEIYIDYRTAKELGNKFDRTIHDGGAFEWWKEYVLETQSFVTEDKTIYGDYPINEYNAFFDMDMEEILVSKTVEFPDFTKETVGDEKFKEYQDIVKRHIMKYGSLYAAISCNEIDSRTGNVYYGKLTDEYYETWLYPNHAVSVVGWDDNYPKENLKSTWNHEIPDNDGAWIVLNTYGEESGFGGFLYVSYEDVFVNLEMAGVISTDVEDFYNLSDIGNEKIEAYIANNYETISKDGKQYISEDTLDSIRYLDLSDLNMDSIKGIEVLKNLNSIDISNNNIQDISYLAQCTKLHYINLSNNNIKDVSALKSLEKLGILDISNNPGVTGYEECKYLSSLNISNCGLESIEGINELEKLTHLDISGNPDISDIMNLRFENIVEFYAFDCELSDLSFIQNSNNIMYDIWLANNPVDLTTLDKELIIYRLDLSENEEIENYSELNDINISTLELIGCNIRDLSKLPTQNQNIYELNLSKNNIQGNFKALCTMGSLYYLNVSECNLGDISSISEVKNLSTLILNGNENVYGTLDSGIRSLSLVDCHLGKDFDFFGQNEITGYTLNGNDVDLSKLAGDKTIHVWYNKELTEEQFKEIPKNIKLSNATVNITVDVPSESKLALYTKDFDSIKYSIDSDKYSARDVSQKVDITNNNIILSEYNNGEYSGCKINYVINRSENAKATELRVSKFPNKQIFDIDEKVVLDGLKLEGKYAGGIFAEITDYEIMYGNEKLHDGYNYIKIVADGLETFVKVKIVEEEGYVVLRFENANFYDQVVEKFNSYGEIIIANPETKVIKLKNEQAQLCEGEDGAFVHVPYEALYDLKAVEGLDIKFIMIFFSEESSPTAKLTKEDMEEFKRFKNLKRMVVADMASDGKDKASRVDDTGEYEICYYSNIYGSVYKMPHIIFQSDKLYESVKSSLDKIYMDYPHLKRLGFTEEQIVELQNSDKGIVVPYNSLYDVKSLEILKLDKITIEFSENSPEYETINSSSLGKLSKLSTLKTIYIVDKSGKKSKDSMIVDQDKYTVYINGELYYQKQEEQTMQDSNNVISNSVNNNSVVNNTVTNNTVMNTVVE